MSLFTRIRNIFRTGKLTDEIDREINFHLDERADDLMAAGVSASDAQAGGAAAVRQCHAAEGTHARPRRARVARNVPVRSAARTPRAAARSDLLPHRHPHARHRHRRQHRRVHAAARIAAAQPAGDITAGARADRSRQPDRAASRRAASPHGMVQQLRRQQRSFVDISSWATGRTRRSRIAMARSGSTRRRSGQRQRLRAARPAVRGSAGC